MASTAADKERMVKIYEPQYEISLEDSAIVMQWVPKEQLAGLGGKKCLIAGLADGQIATVLFDLEADTEHISYIDAHQMGVTVFRWHKDTLATGGEDGKVFLWKVVKGENKTVTLEKTKAIKTKSSWVSDILWLEGKDDKTFIITASGKYVQIWDAASCECTHAFDPCESTVTGLAYSAPMNCLLASYYGAVRAWEMSLEKKRTHEFTTKGSFLSVKAFPKTCTIAAGMQDPMVSLWTVQIPGKTQRMAKQGNPWDRQGRSLNGFELAGYYEKVVSMDIDIDGRYLATAGGPQVVFWDFGPDQVYLANAKPRQILFLGHRDLITKVKFHPASRWMASVCRSGQLCVWDYDQGLKAPVKKNSREMIVAPFMTNINPETPEAIDLAWEEDNWLSVSYANGDLAIFDPIC